MTNSSEFARIRAALARSIHFRELPPTDLDEIARLARVRRLADGEIVARAGSRQKEVWIILEGSMRMSSVTSEGLEFIYALIGPGSFYGLGSLIADVDTTVDAQAAGPTSLAVMDGASFVALLDARPRLWRHVAKMLHRRLTLAMTVVRDISIAPLSQRIVRRLLGQAMSGGSDLSAGQPIELRVTQTDLARMLGAARSKVNAELKRLERAGLVKIGYRTISLVDCTRLRDLAGPDVFAF